MKKTVFAITAWKRPLKSTMNGPSSVMTAWTRSPAHPENSIAFYVKKPVFFLIFLADFLCRFHKNQAHPKISGIQWP